MIEREYVGICLPQWKKEEIERKVLDLYLKHGVDSLPIDPVKIIKERGYELVSFSKINYDNCLQLNGRSDAFSFFNPQQDNYFIVYDDECDKNRLRFTLLHEIAHIDLGHNGESDLAKCMADYFAGYALAPYPIIEKYDCGDVDLISKFFSVSKSCASVCCSYYYKWKRENKELKGYEKTFMSLIK